MHGTESSPSPLLDQQLPALLEAAQLGPLLDVACGRGRHALALAARGATVVALDRNEEALLQLGERGRNLPIHRVRTDLETPHGLPLAEARCGAVVVFRFLYRPLVPHLVRALRPGGLLVYETFTLDQRELGYGPRNPDFLLEPGELPKLFGALEVVSFEEGLSPPPRPEALARLVARKPG